MSESTQKQRISLLMAVLLIGAAFLGDGLQAVLELLAGASVPIPLIDVVVGPAFALLGSFLGIVADICFIFWFYFLGVRYMDKGALLKLLTLGAMTAITIIPGLDILPELTVGVIVLIVQTRIEDAENKLGTAGKIASAAKLLGKVQPELAGIAKVAELQARRQEASARVRQQQEEAAQIREQQTTVRIEEQKNAANDNEIQEERVAA